ncbi:MAG TPA: CPBP family intramembrane glutamic endopeptidase [Vicinamibacterales bacterium]
MLLCSGFPTQLAIALTYVATGHKTVTATGGLSTAYVVIVSLVDTVVVVGLVLTLLLAHGERPRDVLTGGRRLAPEVTTGVLLIPVALVVAGAVLLITQKFAPWLHTVVHNPLQDVLQSPRDAWLFVFVVIFAGGVREEVQRAFILHRFGVWLGGSAVGLVITSVAFGAGHLTQGADAAIATGLLGFLWGAVYLRRRSAVAPMVSHAGFDLLQIAQFLIGR